jgi:hypothetical protein
MTLALTSGGQAGYSDVRIMIHDTFPTDAKKHGTVYIQINSREYIDQAKPRVIQCAGRPHVDVSRELKESLGFEAMGFTVIYIPPRSPKGKKGPGAPHFVAFHKYQRPVYIAWASEIQGLSSDPVRNVPVVWKLSDDVPSLCRHEAAQPARAGGVELVDIRPCLASFTFWFVGCRVTISHMVEITKYDAKMIGERVRKVHRERSEERDKERQRRQRLHERNESDLEPISLVSQIDESEVSSVTADNPYDDGFGSTYNDGLESMYDDSSEYDAQEIQLVAEISFDPDAFENPLVVSEEKISSEKEDDGNISELLLELLNGYTGDMFVAEEGEEPGAEAGTEEDDEEVRTNVMTVLAQRGIAMGDDQMKKLLNKMRT